MIIESSTIQHSITTEVVQNILHNNKDNFIAVIKIVRTNCTNIGQLIYKYELEYFVGLLTGCQ